VAAATSDVVAHDWHTHSQKCLKHYSSTAGSSSSSSSTPPGRKGAADLLSQHLREKDFQRQQCPHFLKAHQLLLPLLLLLPVTTVVNNTVLHVDSASGAAGTGGHQFASG